MHLDGKKVHIHNMPQVNNTAALRCHIRLEVNSNVATELLFTLLFLRRMLPYSRPQNTNTISKCTQPNESNSKL